MNNIINKAIASTNEARELEAIREIQGFMGSIERELAGRKTVVTRITENQAAFKKLAESEVTFDLIAGGPKSVNPTVSEQAIYKAIEQTVKCRAESLEARAKGLSDAIACDQSALVETDKRIAELREKMKAVKVNSVTGADVVGA